MTELPIQISFAVQRLSFVRIKLLRWTQETLGKSIGVGFQYVSDLEKLRKEPRLTTLIRYATSAGITLEVLFKGSPGIDGLVAPIEWKQVERQLKKFGLNKTSMETIKETANDSDLSWALLLAEEYPNVYLVPVKGWLEEITEI